MQEMSQNMQKKQKVNFKCEDIKRKLLQLSPKFSLKLLNVCKHRPPQKNTKRIPATEAHYGVNASSQHLRPRDTFRERAGAASP
jgi:hypothetical protein